MSDVVTGEAVPLELRLAKLPSRALAIAIDVAVYALVGLSLFSLASAVVPALDPALAAALSLASVITLLVAVPATVESLSRGKSLGKLTMGLRVVRDDGGPIRARHALVRALSGVFADFVVTFGVGAVFCSLLNERGKRIGDVLAGTVVLRERIPVLPGLPPIPPELAGWARSLELAQLPDELALTARSYLIRSPELAPHVRNDLGVKLADQVAAVVSPPRPQGVTPHAYLAAVLGERARREAARWSGQQAMPAGPSGPGWPGAGERGGDDPPAGMPSADEMDRGAQATRDRAAADAELRGVPDSPERARNESGFVPPA